LEAFVISNKIGLYEFIAELDAKAIHWSVAGKESFDHQLKEV
jgi:hypothetical protein